MRHIASRCIAALVTEPKRQRVGLRFVKGKAVGKEGEQSGLVSDEVGHDKEYEHVLQRSEDILPGDIMQKGGSREHRSVRQRYLVDSSFFHFKIL